MKTVIVMAEGYLWDRTGIGDCPGNPLPDAADKLVAAKKLGRVVIVTPFANTLAGARQCLDLLYRVVGTNSFDELWCSPGCPMFDILIHDGCGAPVAAEEPK